MRSFLRWTRPAAAAAVLGIMIWRLGSGPFIDGVRAIDGRALVAAAAIFFVTTACCAWRWTLVARGLGVGLSLPDAVSAYYRCLFLNLTLPGGVAGDVHRGVGHGATCTTSAVPCGLSSGSALPGRSSRSFDHRRAPGPVIASALVDTACRGCTGRNCRGRRTWSPQATKRGSSRWALARDAAAADIRGGLLRKSPLPAVVSSRSLPSSAICSRS